jgi:hypothetical protein
MSALKHLTFTILALLSFATARAEVRIHSFTLPSGVSIQIFEAPFTSMPESSCPGLKKQLGELGDRAHRPKTYVKAIEAKFQSKKILFEVNCMTDAWGDRPLSHKGGPRYFGGWCEIIEGKPYCSFRGIFSDASEIFAAEWNVNGYQARRTVFASTSDIVQLFLQNIDPQKFYLPPNPSFQWIV